MAGISVGASQGHQIDAGNAAAVKPSPAKETPVKAAVAALAQGDTVTLSAAAKGIGGSNAGSSQLSDTEAQSQSVSLKQLLSNQRLSTDAKQNQAILSLLR